MYTSHFSSFSLVTSCCREHKCLRMRSFSDWRRLDVSSCPINCLISDSREAQRVLILLASQRASWSSFCIPVTALIRYSVSSEYFIRPAGRATQVTHTPRGNRETNLKMCKDLKATDHWILKARCWVCARWPGCTGSGSGSSGSPARPQHRSFPGSSADPTCSLETEEKKF